MKGYWALRKTYNRISVAVRETGHYIFTKYGFPYAMYSDPTNTYYADRDDNSNEVVKLGVFENEEDAIIAFKEHMKAVDLASDIPF